MSQNSHLDTLVSSTKYPIYLRTIQLQDAARFANILTHNHEDGKPDGKPFETSKAEEIITKMRDSASKPSILGEDGRPSSGPGRVNMIVVLKEDSGQENAIGIGGYGAIKDWIRDGAGVRAGDVGVVIDKAYRGKGYAVEAMKLAIDWAFTTFSEGGPQLDIVTITTAETNAAMIKLIDEKLGLKGKGVKRPGEFDPFEIYYELLPTEWKKFRSE